MTTYWRRPFPAAGDAGATAGSPSPRAGAGADAIVIGRFQGTVVVSLHGVLDLSLSASLGGVLDDLIEGQGNLAIIVDLRDLKRIDGAGVDILRTAAGQIMARGGELRLGRPAGAVFDTLVLSGLAGLIDSRSEGGQPPGSPERPPRHTGREASRNLHPAGTDPPKSDTTTNESS
ncbi:MAG: hypothetical protein QOD63_1352 [Actinomycetota bacterium]|jgi:anti-anti-sigma factor|nr:hypothetical protein [Actinomycetota bacterium]